MGGYFCTRFIDFMLKDKRLLDYINLFSLNEYEKNDGIILKHFQQILKRLKKSYCIIVVNIEIFKTLKYHTFLIKHLFFLLFVVSIIER